MLTAPSFNTRTMGALNKIAEEHWRRQMEEEERATQEVAGTYNRSRLETWLSGVFMSVHKLPV